MSKQGRDQNRTERAAAVRAAQQRQDRNRRAGLTVVIILALFAITAGGVWYSAGSGGTETTPTDAPVAAGVAGVAVGPTSAPTKVVVYEDFQCPYCRQLEQQTRDFLREGAAAGTVQVEYRPINLLAQLPYSSRAMNAFAAVLEHGTPAQALALHDLLYENQPYESDSGSMSEADIAELVAKVGADSAAVKAALKTQNTAFFEGAQQDMASRGINSTPTVFINNEQVAGASVPDMVSAIEDAVGKG